MGYSPVKHEEQNSPFKYLLRPKAGGIGVALSTMPFITTLLDFSISYATETTTLWDFLCGNMSKIRIKVREIDIPEHLLNKIE